MRRIHAIPWRVLVAGPGPEHPKKKAAHFSAHFVLVFSLQDLRGSGLWSRVPQIPPRAPLGLEMLLWSS